MRGWSENLAPHARTAARIAGWTVFCLEGNWWSVTEEGDEVASGVAGGKEALNCALKRAGPMRAIRVWHISK